MLARELSSRVPGGLWALKKFLVFMMVGVSLVLAWWILGTGVVEEDKNNFMNINNINDINNINENNINNINNIGIEKSFLEDKSLKAVPLVTMLTTSKLRTTVTTDDVRSEVHTTHRTDTRDLMEIPQPPDNVLIDIKDFYYVIYNDVCRDVPRLDVLLVVVSAPDHFRHRQMVRRMQGNYMLLKHRGKTLRRVFLLGYESGNQLNEKLEMENNLYKDIIQGSFIDAYRNLTYKYTMALKYISGACRRAKYIIKQDDDMMADLFNLNDQVLDKIPPENVNDTFHCEVFWHGTMPVLRTSGSKWDVKKEEFAEEWYPTYCSGVALVFTPSVAIKLHSVSDQFRYFWIDDAHMGTLANATNITFINYSNMIMHGTGEDVYKLWVGNLSDTRPARAYFGQHHDHDLYYSFWTKTLLVHSLHNLNYLKVNKRDVENSLKALDIT